MLGKHGKQHRRPLCTPGTVASLLLLFVLAACWAVCATILQGLEQLCNVCIWGRGQACLPWTLVPCRPLLLHWLLQHLLFLLRLLLCTILLLLLLLLLLLVVNARAIKHVFPCVWIGLLRQLLLLLSPHQTLLLSLLLRLGDALWL
jgi:hypothetical protein